MGQSRKRGEEGGSIEDASALTRNYADETRKFYLGRKKIQGSTHSRGLNEFNRADVEKLTIQTTPSSLSKPPGAGKYYSGTDFTVAGYSGTMRLTQNLNSLTQSYAVNLAWR